MLELDLHTVQVHDPIVDADQAQPAPGHCLVVAVLEIDPTHPLLQPHDDTSCLVVDLPSGAAVLLLAAGSC